jgi:hypothetical protein
MYCLCVNNITIFDKKTMGKNVIVKNITLTKDENTLGLKLAFGASDRSFSSFIGRIIREDAKRQGVKL